MILWCISLPPVGLVDTTYSSCTSVGTLFWDHMVGVTSLWGQKVTSQLVWPSDCTGTWMIHATTSHFKSPGNRFKCWVCVNLRRGPFGTGWQLEDQRRTETCQTPREFIQHCPLPAAEGHVREGRRPRSVQAGYLSSFGRRRTRTVTTTGDVLHSRRWTAVLQQLVRSHFWSIYLLIFIYHLVLVYWHNTHLKKRKTSDVKQTRYETILFFRCFHLILSCFFLLFIKKIALSISRSMLLNK